jgi:MOSC domain-containing protein YiiM
MTGRLVAIYTTTVAGAPMASHDEIGAIAGAGLEGDRYATNTGEFSDKEGSGREVTLIAREAVAEAARRGVPIGEHETRRNLVTEGVDLLDLIGKTFSVGDVLMTGMRVCPPCGYLQRITRPGVMAALQGGGGLRAEILRDGVVRVGDPITELPDPA